MAMIESDSPNNFELDLLYSMTFLKDLSNWMSELSEDVKVNKNITQIAIPGSHDCGTYSLDKSLPVGPDEADILQTLGNNPILGPTLVKPIMYRWSTTQHSAIADQLMSGIRYFDIR